MALISIRSLRSRVLKCAASRKFVAALADEINECAEQVVFQHLTRNNGATVLTAIGEVRKTRQKKPKLDTLPLPL
jgi:hypothetical protein